MYNHSGQEPKMEVPVHIASNTIFVGDVVLRRILVWTGMVLAGCAPARSQQSENTALTNRALLDRYCVTCHNQKSVTAGLALDKMNLENVGKDAAVWEKVVHKLRTRAMPPAGMPRPNAAS